MLGQSWGYVDVALTFHGWLCPAEFCAKGARSCRRSLEDDVGALDSHLFSYRVQIRATQNNVQIPVQLVTDVLKQSFASVV